MTLASSGSALHGPPVKEEPGLDMSAWSHQSPGYQVFFLMMMMMRRRIVIVRLSFLILSFSDCQIVIFQGFYRKLPTSPGSPYPSFSLDANEALKVITLNMEIKFTPNVTIYPQ